MISLRHNTGGYTIVEVMIVLAVSAALFATAIFGFTQQNRRTQFTESVETFAQNLQDIVNDVETGFYPSNNNVSCIVAGPGPPVPVVDDTIFVEQGSNSGCIFIGKAIQFSPSSDSSAYDTFTVVGRTLIDGTDDAVSRLSEAQPVGIDQLVDQRVLSAGVEIVKVTTLGATPQDLSLLAVVSDSGVSGIANPGFNTRSTLAGNLGGLGVNDTNFLADIITLDNASIVRAMDGVEVCLQESGGGSEARQAVVTLGGADTGKISIKTEIDRPCS